MTAWIGPAVAVVLVLVALLNVLDVILGGRVWAPVWRLGVWIRSGYRHARHRLICRRRPEMLFWTRETDRVCLTCQRCAWQSPGWSR